MSEYLDPFKEYEKRLEEENENRARAYDKIENMAREAVKVASFDEEDNTEVEEITEAEENTEVKDITEVEENVENVETCSQDSCETIQNENSDDNDDKDSQAEVQEFDVDFASQSRAMDSSQSSWGASGGYSPEEGNGGSGGRGNFPSKEERENAELRELLARFDEDFGKRKHGKKKKKSGKSGGIGLTIAILCIVLPIFLIFNLFISNYVLQKQADQFAVTLDEKVTELENTFYDQISYNADLVAYYVAEKCMDEVFEIMAISEQTGIAQGTGFAIAEGYVITNAHVVVYTKTYGNGQYEDTGYETVLLYYADNDTPYEAEVVAFDTDYDLALLKLKNPPQNMQYCEFANSVDVTYGEPCVAIGNAKSKGLSVTEGVVSAPMVNFYFTTDFVTASIQHSAPINSGNSGGPLYNMFGQVIGINTFKISSTDSTEGMGYAMPSVIIKDWVNSLGIDGVSITFAETPEIGSASVSE